ncbi:hypothetical protein N9O57_00050 [bacterium]|nr:hypothetical protein [bacterium]
MGGSINKRSKKRHTLGEGIEFKDYNHSQLIWSLPFGLVLETIWFFQRLVTSDKAEFNENKIPSNAIIVTFHSDSYLDPLSSTLWRKFARKNYYWIGFHGFLSYIGTFRAMMMGVGAYRYRRNCEKRPMDQIRDFLSDNLDCQVMIRTDSGGPYNKVRPSLIDMAIRYDRPLVCMRVHSSKFFLINQHKIALPGAIIRAGISNTIEVDVLKDAVEKGMGNACNLVKKEMDQTLILIS